jgi:hypothetical protein
LKVIKMMDDISDVNHMDGGTGALVTFLPSGPWSTFYRPAIGFGQ